MVFGHKGTERGDIPLFNGLSPGQCTGTTAIKNHIKPLRLSLPLAAHVSDGEAGGAGDAGIANE